MVEQSISSALLGRLAEHRVRDRRRATCLPAGSMVTTTSASLHASAADAARLQPLLDRAAQRLLAEVEGANLMPRLGEVRRHAAAHVAEADECDRAMSLLSSLPIARPLLDEGGHAFLLVLGAEQAVEQAALEADALVRAAFRTRH